MQRRKKLEKQIATTKRAHEVCRYSYKTQTIPRTFEQVKRKSKKQNVEVSRLLATDSHDPDRRPAQVLAACVVHKFDVTCFSPVGHHSHFLVFVAKNWK